MNLFLGNCSILSCRFFPFITLNISCHSLLTCSVSVDKLADYLLGFLCMLSFISCCLWYFISVFTFCQFGYYVSWCAPIGFILPGTLCASWTWLTISFPMLGKFSVIMFCSFWSLYELKYYTYKGQSLENVYFRLWTTFFYRRCRVSISKHRQQSINLKGTDSIWSQGSSLLQYLCKEERKH